MKKNVFANKSVQRKRHDLLHNFLINSAGILPMSVRASVAVLTIVCVCFCGCGFNGVLRKNYIFC